jgi:hypothetical protein
MTLRHDRPLAPAAGTVHVDPPAVDTAPPTRSKVTAALAAVACVACCALPLLIAAGVLTGAGAAIAQNVLLGASGLLVAVAGGMWWLHRRRSARTARLAAAGGRGGCAGGDDCAC